MNDLRLKSIIPILERDNIDRAGLFGSFARGQNNLKSDVDILINYTGGKSLLDIIGLEMELSDMLGHKVDLVTERSLNPRLKDMVLNDLVVFYERG